MIDTADKMVSRGLNTWKYLAKSKGHILNRSQDSNLKTKLTKTTKSY